MGRDPRLRGRLARKGKISANRFIHAKPQGRDAQRHGTHRLDSDAAHDAVGKRSFRRYSLVEGTLREHASSGNAYSQSRIYEIAEWIVRGGWPGALDLSASDAVHVPRGYIAQLEENDIHRIDNIRRNVHKIDLLLRSLARNESTTASIGKLCADISGTDRETVDPDTVSAYLNALQRLFVIEDQRPFHANARSSVRVKQSEKRHFCDPSLACAVLRLTTERLVGDLNFMGFLFEELVERDLRVYAASFGAQLMHYQDYSNRELDAVIEMENGDWAAVEIKLGAAQEDAAAANLLAIRDAIAKEPKGRPQKSLIVVLGCSAAADTRPDGVHAVPVSAFRP